MKTSKWTILFQKISKIKVIILLFMTIYFTILVIYDIHIYRRPALLMIITYLAVLIMGIVAFAMAFGFILFLIMSKVCSNKVVNIILTIVLSVLGLFSLIFAIEFFVEYFLIATFIPPFMITGVILAQSFRFNKNRNSLDIE